MPKVITKQKTKKQKTFNVDQNLTIVADIEDDKVSFMCNNTQCGEAGGNFVRVCIKDPANPDRLICFERDELFS
jgi:hypothetical protein